VRADLKLYRLEEELVGQLSSSTTRVAEADGIRLSLGWANGSGYQASIVTIEADNLYITADLADFSEEAIAARDLPALKQRALELLCRRMTVPRLMEILRAGQSAEREAFNDGREQMRAEFRELLGFA
jgi:uncharacterized protein with von Willebrand factor type A (vWA) domain